LDTDMPFDPASATPESSFDPTTAEPDAAPNRKDVPDMGLGSVAKDIGSGVLQIAPTAIKGVADIGRLVTGDRIGTDLSSRMDADIKTIQNQYGSERSQAQRDNFNLDMADDSVSMLETMGRNKGAIADQILPTVGSMFLPIGVAGAAGKVATAGKAIQGMDKAAIAARVASAQQAAGIGATVAQNAADTFSTLLEKGYSMEDAYLGAGITVPFTAIAGKLTGGGAEMALTRAVTGSGAVGAGAKAIAKGAAREGAQEMGEEAGQITGEAAGSGVMPSATQAGKRMAVAGTLGAIMGGGVDTGIQASQGFDPLAQELTALNNEIEGAKWDAPAIDQEARAALTPNLTISGIAVDRFPDAKLERFAARLERAGDPKAEEIRAELARRQAAPIDQNELLQQLGGEPDAPVDTPVPSRVSPNLTRPVDDATQTLLDGVAGAGSRILSPADLPDSPASGERGAPISRGAGSDLSGIVSAISGRELAFIEPTDGAFDGVVANDTHVFLNTRQSVSPVATAFHEVAHAMRSEAPEAYSGFVSSVSGLVDTSEKALLDFAQTYNGKHYRSQLIATRLKAGESHGEILNDLLATDRSLRGMDGLLEEFHSDLIGDAANSKGVLRQAIQRMGQTNIKSLRKFAGFIDSIITRVEASLGTGFGSERYVKGSTKAEVLTNLKAVRDAAAEALAKYGNFEKQQDRYKTRTVPELLAIAKTNPSATVRELASAELKRREVEASYAQNAQRKDQDFDAARDERADQTVEQADAEMRAAGAEDTVPTALEQAFKRTGKFSPARESAADHKMQITREERELADKTKLTRDELTKVSSSAKQFGLPAKTVEMEVRRIKARFPESVGWAPLEFLRVDPKTMSKKANEKTPLPADAIFFAPYGYQFHLDAQGKDSKATRGARVKAIASALAGEISGKYMAAQQGDPVAKIIMRQSDWYQSLRGKLRATFGGFGDFLAQLLGPTSANNPVEPNFKYGVEALKLATSGKWDSLFKEVFAWKADIDAAAQALDATITKVKAEGLKGVMKDPRVKAAMANLKSASQYKGTVPLRENGKQFGMASAGIQQILAEEWGDKVRGDAPKTKNYYQNIMGRTFDATVDVWAARTLRRLANNVVGNFPRIPPVAETAVAGNVLADNTTSGSEFGFGQDVFKQAADELRASGIEQFKSITPDAVQAMVWFIEKETWATRNWTTKVGEEGSIEHELLLAGYPDRKQVDAWRVAARAGRPNPETKALQGRPDKLEAAVAKWQKAKDIAAAELAQIERYPDRFVAGVTTEIPGGKPTDAEMASTAREIEAALASDKVVASRAVASTGEFMGDFERTLDVEVVARNGYDAMPLWSKLVEIGQREGQQAVFLSRVLREDETAAIDPGKHRPGVEIYFAKPIGKFEAAALMAVINEAGVHGMTLATEGRRTPSAMAGEDQPIAGIRMQHIPEFSLGYDYNVSMTNAEIQAAVLEARFNMDRLVEELNARADVSTAKALWYETRVHFYGNQNIFAQGAAGRAAGESAAGVWSGQQVSEALESADRFARDGAAPLAARRAELRQLPGRGAPAAKLSPVRGSEQPAAGSRAAGVDRQGDQQLGRTDVTGVHYSTQQREHLTGLYFGTGLKGEEGARIRDAKDQRIKSRLYAYVNEGQGVFPEAGVGSYAHTVQFDNLYDIKADPLGIRQKTQDANDRESMILDAGFDGYYAPQIFGRQGVAILMGGAATRGVKPTNAGAAVQAQANPIAGRKDLPMGKMTGAEWKKLVPEAKVEDDQTYYKDQLKFSPGRFYSQLERAIEQAPDRVFGSANQVKLWLAGNAGKLGVKQDEIQWTGINDWLDLQGKAKISKADVINYLKQNGVQVEEVEKSNEGAHPTIGEIANDQQLFDKYYDGKYSFDELSSEDRISLMEDRFSMDRSERIKTEDSDTKYEQYVLPGGENYRELLLRLPKKPNEYGGESGILFSSNHWQESNILAHVRYNDRTDAEGNKVLFIEELQSDWGQEGKKKGFERKREYEPLSNDEFDSFVDFMKHEAAKAITEKLGGDLNMAKGVVRVQPMAQIAEWAGMETEWVRMQARQQENHAFSNGLAFVPKAPFVTDTKAWLSLGIKRMVAYAVENGYDKVAFVNGEQSAERYDLSKQINRVGYDPQNFRLLAHDHSGATVIDKNNIDPEQLEDYIGKDTAKKLLDTAVAENGYHMLEGQDLKGGGSGMKIFYDKIVPQTVSDVLKKLGGGKVETVTIPRGDLKYHPVGYKPDYTETSQLGFAITPALRDKVSQGMPLFSPVRGATALPEETKAQAAQRVGQDKFNRWNEPMRQWMAENGLQMSEQADVYRAEERFHGRVASRLEDFRELTVKPLIKKIQKAGFSMQDVSEFLEAQHTPEANAQIRKLANDPHATAAGVTDQDAVAYLATAPAELKRLANEFRQITESAKQLLVTSGVISSQTAAAWSGAYKHYVPLKGGEEDVAAKSGTGQGQSVNGKQKRRLGHGKRDEHIVENIVRDFERAVMTSEKNLVGQHLLSLAVELQQLDPDLITVDKPEKRKALMPGKKSYDVSYHGSSVATFQNRGDANTFVQTLGRPGLKITELQGDPFIQMMAAPMLQENEAQIYVAGQAVRVQINDPILAREYKNLGVEHLNKVLQVGREINGWLSKAYTGYNPEFVFVNMARDFTGGTINLMGNYGPKIVAETLKNYPKAIASVFRYSVTGKATPDIQQYRENGGTTGAAYLSDIERVGKDIERSFNEYVGVVANLKQGNLWKAARAAGRETVGKTLGWIEHFNVASENAMRLAAFIAVRDATGSVAKGASAAKNVTVNFNRKGETGNVAGALYLFANPNIQGTAALTKALLKGDHKGKAWALVGGMVALAMLMAAQFDDDEWKEIPDYEKDRNLLIRVGDTRVKIPVPYGYGFFFGLGNIYRNIQAGESVAKQGVHLASSFFEHFSPFGNPVQSPITMLPTAIKIPMEPALNINDFGRKIVPEYGNNDEDKPDFLKMGRTAKGSSYASVSKGLSDLTGGTKATAGLVDVSPETLKYWTKTTTGGTGAFYADAANYAKILVEGATPELHEVPVVRKFAGEHRVNDTRSHYYDAIDAAKKADVAFDVARKAGDREGMTNIRTQKAELLALANAADSRKKAIKAIRDRETELLNDESKTLVYRREAVKVLEKQEEEIYRSVLRSVGHK
jgi:DNA-binding transcriptional MerR regulator